MREEESSWFSRWEEELPAPEELTPLSQTLITRDLAVAFDIQTPVSFNAQQQFRAPGPSSGELDSSSSEPARTLKRPRLVWTPQLHKRFVDAVAHLGIKNAVPKTIMQLMSVDGLTRENVASHLQKYRLYLKRMQGGLGATAPAPGDAATDRLFATSPVPPHLLAHVPPPVGLHHHHHHLQNRQMGHYSGGAAQFDHPFLARQAHVAPRFGGGGAVALQSSGHGFVEDVDLGTPSNARNVLTLFPAAQD